MTYYYKKRKTLKKSYQKSISKNVLKNLSFRDNRDLKQGERVILRTLRTKQGLSGQKETNGPFLVTSSFFPLTQTWVSRVASHAKSL